MDAPRCPGRRRAIRRMAALAGGAVLLEIPALTGCAPGPKEPGTLRVPLGSLTAGVKTFAVVSGTTVELTRTGDGVAARSLTCTHWGCTVRWDEAARRYKCPCHHGEYDAEGNVVLGPPPHPLRMLPVEIAGDTVIVRMPGAVTPPTR